MNIVSIDPSLNNTAVVINGNNFAFVNREVSTTKSGNLSKWFELAAPFVVYHQIDYTKLEDYSANEVNKLGIYDEITSEIRDVVLENINPTGEIKVFIEGYSYSSEAGPIIDLVAFGTLIRKKMYDLTEYLHIVSPTQLKALAAKLTYPVTLKGKKVIKEEYRNHEGISGGAFTKKEIFKAIVENNNLQNDWANFLRKHQEEILNYKHIAKPIEDINDAYILYEYYRNG